MIATTNRLESISPTLRRPGRLDLEVEVGVPGVEERSQILQVYLDQESHSLSRSDIETVAKVILTSIERFAILGRVCFFVSFLFFQRKEN